MSGPRDRADRRASEEFKASRGIKALRGLKALHAPDLFVFHERRSTLRGFARQCFLSGRGRIEMTVKAPHSFKPVFLLPPLLLAGVALAPLLPGLLYFPVLAYAALAAVNGGALALRCGEGAAGWLWMTLLFPSAHLSYGVGAWAGLARMVLPRPSASRMKATVART